MSRRSSTKTRSVTLHAGAGALGTMSLLLGGFGLIIYFRLIRVVQEIMLLTGGPGSFLRSPIEINFRSESCSWQSRKLTEDRQLISSLPLYSERDELFHHHRKSRRRKPIELFSETALLFSQCDELLLALNGTHDCL